MFSIVVKVKTVLFLTCSSKNGCIVLVFIDSKNITFLEQPQIYRNNNTAYDMYDTYVVATWSRGERQLYLVF